MFNKFLLLVSLLSIHHSTAAQQHDNIWMVGVEWSSSTFLDFSLGSGQVDTVVRNVPMGSVGYSMSDSVGNLIFYTNGIKINNAQKQLMENGDSLNPGQVADNFRNSGLPNSQQHY